VARNTRQRRRQRRARTPETEPQQGMTQRARARQQQVRPAAQPPKTQTGARRVPGGGFRRFVGESVAELKKVEWPGRRQLFSATIVVIIAVAVVGAYLYVADLALSRFVRDVLLSL
jgi:preprotein translocase subunit SecE